MLEKLFTTKMSADKKKLQNRFSKIRSDNGKMSKTIGICLFCIVIILVLAVSVIVAVKNYKDVKKEVKKDNDYIMTDKEFSEYIKRPVGSMMADIDYIDEQKLVFHYVDGFFVIDMKNDKILHKINVDKLNVAGHNQGDCFTEFNIDKDGKFAYLTNDGNKDLVKKYDNYIINLESGDVTLGNVPEKTQLFSDYDDTFSKVQDIIGWCSDRCIVGKDGKIYYLTTEDGIIGGIQLVTVDTKQHNNTSKQYVFDKDYVSFEQLKQNLISESLNENEEILVNSGWKWEVNDEVVKSVINKLSATRQMKYIDIKSGNYDVRLYDIWDNTTEENQIRMLIIDNYKLELVMSQNITLDEYKYLVNMLNNPEIPQRELYPYEIKDITDAQLVINGTVYPIIVRDNIGKIEQMLFGSEIIKGGTDCPLKGVLVLTNKDGEKGIVTLATDSCAVFMTNGTYYDYSDGDNSEMLSFFGIDAETILDLTT